ncbi:sugar transferase [Patescibacteria group bacterium]|nr:sugar transferase [Patescibacteria group bacterium]
MQRILALCLLILFLPFFVLLFLIVKLTSKGSFLFKQKRLGKDKKPFYIYKIRTMVIDAENKKSGLKDKNEADGPVFKIRNDPRYTKFGCFLAHSGLDELPQLWNIVRGEMAFVGPRPFPIEESSKIPEKYQQRFTVLPGISSLWVIGGTDHKNFDRWMELDLEYIEKKSLWYDIKITAQTVSILLKLTFDSLKK